MFFSNYTNKLILLANLKYKVCYLVSRIARLTGVTYQTYQSCLLGLIDHVSFHNLCSTNQESLSYS